MIGNDHGIAWLGGVAVVAILLASCGGAQYTPDVEFTGATMEAETSPAGTSAEVAAGATCSWLKASVEATVDLTDDVQIITSTVSLDVMSIDVITSLVCDLEAETCEWCVWALRQSDPVWCLEWGGDE